jgi:hypothetical protein
MNTNVVKVLLCAASSAVWALAAGPAMAQELVGLSVEPAQARPGETVRITARFDIASGLNCGVRFHFGDGKTQDAKINQEKDANYVVPYQYAQPGSYTVMVEPKTEGLVGKCLGNNLRRTVAVVVPAAPAAAPAPAAAAAPAVAAAPAPATQAKAKPAGPSCPAGWALVAKSVNKKTGAFDCSAKPGTAAPAGKLDCPGALGYYENTKTGKLGCRP